LQMLRTSKKRQGSKYLTRFLRKKENHDRVNMKTMKNKITTKQFNKTGFD